MEGPVSETGLARLRQWAPVSSSRLRTQRSEAVYGSGRVDDLPINGR